MDLAQLNSLSGAEMFENFLKCCHCREWAQKMVDSAPFQSREHLLELADLHWSGLGPDHFREAFAGHPMIGADVSALRAKFAATADWSSNEQKSVQNASEEVLQRLAHMNQQYLQKFGFIFIVCATGKTAPEMLALLEERFPNPLETEILIAAGEQAKITKIRLNKLLAQPASKL
eukprot:TRINITY_DN35413_c0_g1_i1.p1 TRINITY_DN35413_c0_g1~~TRINITY_DN35413_c0_g1_i1.p1  ORF type:complete len:200 (+),score=24.45 TRINITY_DN35413_c0_g1_i1:78-602(+)